eukprot:3922032-Prymnesium_polylepis.1
MSSMRVQARARGSPGETGGASTASPHTTGEEAGAGEGEAAGGAACGGSMGRPSGGSNGPRPTRERISSTMSR